MFITQNASIVVNNLKKYFVTKMLTYCHQCPVLLCQLLDRWPQQTILLLFFTMYCKDCINGQRVVCPLPT